MEKVVIYLPDIRSCLPTRNEYETLRDAYKATVQRLINMPAVQNGDHQLTTIEPIISISDDDKNININSNNSDNAEPTADVAAADVPAAEPATEGDEVASSAAETDKALNYIDYKPKKKTKT